MNDPIPDPIPDGHVRVWYADSTFLDVPADHAWECESDPDWLRTERRGEAP